MRSLPIRIVLLLAVLAGAFAGCTRKTPLPTDVQAPAVQTPKPMLAMSPATAEEMDHVAPAARRYKIALVVKTRNNPFFEPMIREAEAEAERLGVDLEVQAPPQETDKERQFDMVRDLAARGVDAILITPADSKGIVPALKFAQERGVLVINVDNRVDPETARLAGLQLGGFVSADNEAGGRLAGERMMAYLEGAGYVAILEGIRGADNAEARKRGFESAVAGSLEIVASDTAEWDTQKAYAKFQSILAAHPELQGVFAANDKMALGAIQAIREARRRDEIIVIGYDNIPDVRPHLESGAMDATIEQHPDRMGKYSVSLAVAVLEGKMPKGRELMVPLEAIGRATDDELEFAGAPAR